MEIGKKITILVPPTVTINVVALVGHLYRKYSASNQNLPQRLFTVMLTVCFFIETPERAKSITFSAVTN